MTSDPTLQLDDLAWLGHLGRRLAADPQVAEDAVQETWLAAQGRPEGGARPRAWLATVLRNWLRQHRRAERARHERQQRAARHEATEGTAELVQRAEVQRQLVDSVLLLPAVYRDVILLRFFDGEPPRAIARRLAVPVATVHSRLQRALGLLRARLDDRSGGRAAWLAALPPVPPSLPALLTLEVLAMNAKLKLVVAAVVVAGLVPFVWPAGEGPAGTGAETARPAPLRAPSGAGGGAGDPSGAAATTRRRLAAHPVASRPAPAPATFHAAGRVLDERGAAAALVEIGVRGSGPRATSDAAGRFELALPAGPSTLVATDERWVTVLAATWSPEARYEPVVVVAPSQSVRGRVLDENGAAVPGALLAVHAPEGFDARFSLNLDRTQRQRWETRSAGDGTFRLARLPRLADATIFVAADAFRPVNVPLPAGGEHLEIVLERFAYEAGQLTGVVVDPLGAPVEGARVAMGVTSVVTDGAGRFGLPLRRAGWPSALVAAKAGHLPARCEVPRDGGTRVEEWPRRIVLQLGPRPLSLRGRVVDQTGARVEGALVWVADPTPLGIVGLLPVQTEYVLAGGAVPAFATRMNVRHADDPKVDEDVTEQNGVVSEPSAGWYFVKTDAQGEFEVPGLLPREYTLRALDPATAMTADGAPEAAGGRVEIRLTREGVWPLVSGRVLSQRGEPVAGVEVRQLVSAFRVDARVPGGRFRGSAIHPGQRTTTGADGSFRLRDIGSSETFLHVSADAIMPRSVATKDIADPEQLVIEVEARCHVEVAIGDPAEADEVAARDAQGKGVDLAVLRANSNMYETALPLHEGKSGVFVLSERATELLLLRQGKVVRTVPLALQPGKPLRVQ